MIIGISGVKNAGKGVVSDMLRYLLNAPKFFRSYWWYTKLRFPGKYKITSFAKPLKRVLGILLGVPAYKLNDRNFKENWYVRIGEMYPMPGDLVKDNYKLPDAKFSKMVKSGDPLVGEYLSIRQLMQYVGTEVMRTYLGDNLWINSTLQGDDMIISDLRFENELDAVHNKKGIVIYVQRDSAPPGSHVSEREVIGMYENDKFDYVIENNGTLEDLFNKVKELVTKL